MEEAGANVFQVETFPTPIATLDEAIRAKIGKLPKLKIAQIRSGMTSTCMAQMVLLHHV